MSLGGRATKGGTSKGGSKQTQEKAKTADKPQPKEKVKPQATTEQIRLAQMMDRKSADPSEVRKMVQQLMEMTCKSEEEVCCALHDTDNDMSAACYLLLDDSQHKQSEWQTNEKKKKKPPVPGNNGDIEPSREPRSRSGPRPRRGETDGGRGRGGRGRGGRGGRGRRSVRGDLHVSSDLGHQSGDPFPATEDWENEEWSGSLSDSKVFTPTVKPQILPDDSPQSLNTAEDWDAIPETNNGDLIPSYTYHNTNHVPQTQRREPQERSPVSGLTNLTPKEQTSPLDSYVTSHQHQENSNTLESYVSSHQHQVNNPMGMSGSLSAAQSQYLSQLTQQTQRHDNSVYSSNYGVYGSPDMSTQRKQRARVPPPSKIPMSAVEMPAGAESTFLDVTFGEPEPAHPVVTPVSVPPLPEPPVVAPALDTATEPTVYSNSPSMQQLTSEQLTVTPTVEPIPPPAASLAAPDLPPATTVSLENQLSATMKQLSVGVAESTTPHYSRHKQPTYAPHHPPVYTPNVYAPQVNSTNSSLSAVPSAMNASYPPVTLSQYQQPAINYQQTSSSASVYGGSALYTAAPYNTYQHHQQHHSSAATKEPSQYDTPVSSTNNSLTNTSSTHTTTAKVTTTTVSSAVTASSVSSVSGTYVPQPAQYYGYDEQMMRGSLPHHMGGYYEVGYGRDGFGLSGERFARTENASPQQVAVPAGYAYFYQPPPNTYQYGVYPQYGSGGGVGNVSAGSGGKVSSYQQAAPYEAQDNYKSGPYTANTNKTAAAPAADITNAMYAKAHVALNKVNSYDKAAFHSGTPPPFSAGHVYIPSHHPLHHTQHQMDMRLSNSHSRRESGPSSRGSNKPAPSKQYNAQSYWSN